MVCISIEKPLDYLEKRANDNWLIGYESAEFNQLALQLYQEFKQLYNSGYPPKIILGDRNPVKFLASFIAATAAGCSVFLCNPDWVKAEWQQVFDLVQPDLILGEYSELIRQNTSPPYTPSPYPPLSPRPRGEDKEKLLFTRGMGGEINSSSLIMIPTGGSSGQIRFAIHTWETLMASVGGFRQYFYLDRVNSFCVLPLYHVSGLMQFMRSFTSGGRLVIMPFKTLQLGEKYDVNPSDFFISLVPTQLQSLLENPDLTAWLSRFQTVLLGGAPAWLELLEQARSHRIRLAPTYGMTETASQIATLKPEVFLAGNNTCGQILPHAKVTIRGENGEILGINETGIFTIKADSLALGYYPEFFPKSDNFQQDDLGFFDEYGNLKIIGRSSNKIITGGENVFPNEVEAAIIATQIVADVCVIGLPDRHWGQAVTAIYVPTSKVTIEKLQSAIQEKLSKFKRPKYWIAVETLPRNPQGKINREELQQIAIRWQQHHSTVAAIE